MLLIGGAFISLAFTYTFATDDTVIHAACVALTAALMGFVLYLILALDRRFVGNAGEGVDDELSSRAVWIWAQSRALGQSVRTLSSGCRPSKSVMLRVARAAPSPMAIAAIIKSTRRLPPGARPVAATTAHSSR